MTEQNLTSTDTNETEDTEGHFRRDVGDTEDDVEGHARRDADDAGEAEDDVEGHFRR